MNEVSYIDLRQKIISYKNYGNGTIELFEEGDVVAHGSTVNVNCFNCTCVDGLLMCEGCPCTSCQRVWGDWTPCPDTCDGVGKKQYRHPHVLGRPQWDKSCGKPDVRDCPVLPGCEDAQCNWGAWHSWSACTTSDPCQVEKRERTRSCSCGHSMLCDGSDTQIGACPSTGNCSATTQCASPYVLDDCGNACGMNCPAYSIGICEPSESCDRKCSCPPGRYFDSNTTACVTISQCSCMYRGMMIGADRSADVGCKRCECTNGAVMCSDIPGCNDCIYSSWTDWNKCEGTCGTTGTTMRTREVLAGVNCTDTEEVKNCTENCPSCLTELIANNTLPDPTLVLGYCGLVSEVRFLEDATGDFQSVNLIQVNYCLGVCGRQGELPLLSFVRPTSAILGPRFHCIGDVVDMREAVAIHKPTKTKWIMYYPVYANCRCAKIEI